MLTFDERVVLHRVEYHKLPMLVPKSTASFIRGGLASMAHRRLHHSTPGLRVIKKTRRKLNVWDVLSHQGGFGVLLVVLVARGRDVSPLSRSEVPAHLEKACCTRTPRPISQYSGRDCVNILRSCYTRLYPKTHNGRTVPSAGLQGPPRSPRGTRPAPPSPGLGFGV